VSQKPDSAKPRQQIVVPAPKVDAPEEGRASYYKLGLQEPDWMDQIDPELGKMSTRDKRSMMSNVRGSVSSTFGQVLIAAGISTALLCGLIFTLTAEMWNPSYVLGALLIPSLFYSRHKYRQWSRRRGYLVRLAETLGEEV